MRSLRSYCAFFALSLIATLALGQSSAILSGKITDAAASPIKTASLMLSSLDRVFQGASETDGKFRFATVPPGTYELQINADPFVTQRLAIRLSAGESQSVNIILKLGQIPNAEYCGAQPVLRYALMEGNAPRLSGTIRDDSEQRPVNKADITLVPIGDNQAPTLSAVSKQGGHFKLDDVPAGRYTLFISRAGYSPGPLRELLVPREDKVFIDFPLTKRHMFVVCQ
jgi:hypothetical protein